MICLRVESWLVVFSLIEQPSSNTVSQLWQLLPYNSLHRMFIRNFTLQQPNTKTKWSSRKQSMKRKTIYLKASWKWIIQLSLENLDSKLIGITLRPTMR